MNMYWTIPGFEQLTKQQLFDMAAAHIKSTGKKSASNGICCYASSGCAASPFLQKKRREDADLVAGSAATGWRALQLEKYVPDTHASFVEELQTCHDWAEDGEHFMIQWTGGMIRLAERHGLSSTVLD